MRIRTWGIFLAASSVSIAVFVVAGDDSHLQAWLFLGLTSAEAAAVVWATFGRGLRTQRFWLLVALSFVAYLPANFIWYGVPVLGGDPIGYPSIADGLYIVAYLTYLAGVFLLARSSERLNRGEMIDAAIVSLAAAVAYWTLVIDPTIDESGMSGIGRLVTLAYPAIDIALAAILGRTIVGARRKPAAFWLVAGSVGAQLLADLGYAAQTIGGSFSYGRWVTVGYMVQYALMGAAVLHPTAARIAESVPGTGGGSKSARQVLMGTAMSVGPLLLLVSVVRQDLDRAAVAVGGAVALVWLIVRRLSGLMVTIDVHRSTEERLREAELRYRALVESVPGIVYMAEHGDNGAWRYVSPKISDILGYTPMEWLRHPSPWSAHVHPDDRAEALEVEQEGLATGHMTSLYRMFSRDRRQLWIYDEATLVPGPAGEPIWQGMMTDITWMKEAEQRLQLAGEERRRLLERLVTAQEEERARLANDLHDDPIQKMTAAGLRLAALSTRAPQGFAGALDEVQETVSTAIDRLRKLMFELRPASLDRQGLGAAIGDYLHEASQDGGFTFEVRDGMIREPDEETRATIYRITQEALTNVRKHAGAKHVAVVLETLDGGTSVKVSDNGRGFSVDTAKDRGHLGLMAMRERAELLGGWCRIHSEPKEGTTVEFWVPTGGETGPPKEPAAVSERGSASRRPAART